MTRARFLLQMLLAVLATRGLAAQTLDPWRGWVAFKHFARLVDESPDPGIGVQITPSLTGRVWRLFLVRQEIQREDEWLEPVGGVVCEFTFAARNFGQRPPTEWELWSFECPSLERFVDRVEQHPDFAELMTRHPKRSRVYWAEA